MLNLIDVEPLHPGWGRVWQSGVIASWLDVDKLPEHSMVVSMSGNENWITWPCLWLNIRDDDEYVLPDAMLAAICGMITSDLSRGFDVLIHCNEGKYRSTYMDVAIHIWAAGMSFERAFETIKARHPIASLRAGTAKQLQAMVPLP